MKRHIPNIITCMNLFSGCIASVMAFEGNYLWVVFWIILAAIFDFFDGFSARLLKSQSPIGKELDSMADMVSFGVAPSILIFRFISDMQAIDPIQIPFAEYLPYIGFLIAIGSGLRLANFNIDERQTDSFIGLNTPANTLFWISLCYGIKTNIISVSPSTCTSITIVLVIIFSLLLNAEIPMFSLKVKSIRLRGNELRYALFVFIIMAVILWGVIGISAGIILYILLSILSNFLEKRKFEDKGIS